MKNKTIKGNVFINFLLVMFAFFILANQSNAQADCKRKLDEYNRKNPFPTGQINDYESCLENLSTSYKNLINSEKNLLTAIREVENDLARNQQLLETARDSTEKARYTDLGKQLTSKKDSLNTELRKIDRSIYKNTLSEAYQKIIDYFTSIEDPKSQVWLRKFEEFKQLN